MKTLREERAAAIEAHDHKKLKAVRRHLHSLNRDIRRHTIANSLRRDIDTARGRVPPMVDRREFLTTVAAGMAAGAAPIEADAAPQARGSGNRAAAPGRTRRAGVPSAAARRRPPARVARAAAAASRPTG